MARWITNKFERVVSAVSTRYDTVVDTFSGEKISESVKPFKGINSQQTDGIIFLEMVTSFFEKFDQSNKTNKNSNFSADVEFITDRTLENITKSIDSEMFSSQIDSYLYIYRRVLEYSGMIKPQPAAKIKKTIEELRKKLLEQLTSVFEKTRGEEPILQTKDVELLKRMNILELLDSIKNINEEKVLKTFFALCKLTFQAAICASENNMPQWKDVLFKVERISIPLETLTHIYMEYVQAFHPISLDVPVFITLIQKTTVLKDNQASPFAIYIRLLKSLDLNIEQFFSEFHQTFEHRLKANPYKFQHTVELLILLTKYPDLFGKYLSSCHSFLIESNIFSGDMFLRLSEKIEFNENIQDHMNSIFPKYFAHSELPFFMKLMASAFEIQAKISPEYKTYFIHVLKAIFDAFVEDLFNDINYLNNLSDNELTRLLHNGIKLLSNSLVEDRSCALLIQRIILFKPKNLETAKASRMLSLFEKLDTFDHDLCKNNDPGLVIQDEWLNDYVLRIPEEWLDLDQRLYKQLCEKHKHNRWAIHIWSRWIQMGLSKSSIKKPHEIIIQVNEWMEKVGCTVFSESDILTTIFAIKVFECVMVQNMHTVMSFPKMESVLNFVFGANDNQTHHVNERSIDEFKRTIQNSIKRIFALQGTRSEYHTLLSQSNVLYYLRFVNMNAVLPCESSREYKLPRTSQDIDSIMGMEKPNGIESKGALTDEDYFQYFVKQVNEWIEWFDRFFDSFQYMVKWLQNYRIEEAAALSEDIQHLRTTQAKSINDHRQTIDKVLKILKPFRGLRRLSNLFNRGAPFQIVVKGTIEDKIDSRKCVQELKRLQSNNEFTVDAKSIAIKPFSINDRHYVYWSIASDNHACDLQVCYKRVHSFDQTEILYEGTDIPVNKYVLHGEFETQHAGNLSIQVINNGYAPRVIWFQIKQTPLPKCHLFDGIFDWFYKKHLSESDGAMDEKLLSEILDSKVFPFIEELMNGNINLQQMAELKHIFCDKNISVQDEVKKLFENQLFGNNLSARETNSITADEKIKNVCEMLRSYQYYSYISIIINCIKEFQIIPASHQSGTLQQLEQLNINESCTIRDISNAYELFKTKCRHQHEKLLQLIKAAVEYSAVVKKIKESDLYSPQGQRRFQELRDHLTTQFQLQEKNNMILNSLIVTIPLCEPFVCEVNTFEEFLEQLARLPKFEESSLDHIKVVNDNIQMVSLWLSTKETTVFDNALITMEHLYKTGKVHIYLRHLLNEQSGFEIDYFIHKNQNLIVRGENNDAHHENRTQVANYNQENTDEETDGDDGDDENRWKETTYNNQDNVDEESDDDDDDYDNEEQSSNNGLKFTLSKADIDDHKRQLTFCRVDLDEDMTDKKMLLDEQLKLLQLIDDIFLLFIKLEMVGHPDYQLNDKCIRINHRARNIDTLLSNVRNDPDRYNNQLLNALQCRRTQVDKIFKKLESDYKTWTDALERYKSKNRLLRLFSNRQIMNLIILLTMSRENNRVKYQFIKKWYSLEDNSERISNEDISNLSVQFLINYMRSLRTGNADVSEDKIATLYKKHEISHGGSIDTYLGNLSSFLKEFSSKEHRPLKSETCAESRQYIISLKSGEQTINRKLLDNVFDVETWCTLMSLFQNRLPSSNHILWCMETSEDDIKLFYTRVQSFCNSIFIVMDIDRMHPRLRELLLQEQESLVNCKRSHGVVYYFSQELTASRRGLRPFLVTPTDRNMNQIKSNLAKLFEGAKCAQPQIEIICGKSGIGKTHYIKTKCKSDDALSITVNDKINLPLMISSFLLYGSKSSTVHSPSVIFNISARTPFEDLNRILFSMFVCGSLVDPSSGLTFSLPTQVSWKFIIEVPYVSTENASSETNINQILPILSIVSKSSMEVTNENNKLHIGKEEELVARFLKAYSNKTINRLCKLISEDEELPVEFDKLTNQDECQQYINDCLKQHVTERLRDDKICQLSVTKFLHRRVLFFEGFFYKHNMMVKDLGTTAMEQMINEAKSLLEISFKNDNYPRVFLVYDPCFALQLLHNNWNQVPHTLKKLWDYTDPSTRDEFKEKNYLAICLSWLINIPYNAFLQIMNESKFVLTENFAYKLFHIHERKLTRLPLIIEGETGVGKTFLLKFYADLLNTDILLGDINNNISPRFLERTNNWLYKWLTNRNHVHELPLWISVVQQMKQNLIHMNNREQDNLTLFDAAENEILLQEMLMDIDPKQTPTFNFDRLLSRSPAKEIANALTNYRCNVNCLKSILTTILTVWDKAGSPNIVDYIQSQLTTLPLIEGSSRLRSLLEKARPTNVEESIELLDEFLSHTRIKPLFYRLLLHPGITENELEQFMLPISKLADRVPNIELLVFFDEVNTSSCLGLIKEMFIDKTLHGVKLPQNIFFTGAINPARKSERSDNQVYRVDYLVHELPQSLQKLVVPYGILESNVMKDYINQKIAKFEVSIQNSENRIPLSQYAQHTLTKAIINAQEFCEKKLAPNTVSQREIQRCFTLIDYFWSTIQGKSQCTNSNQYAVRCIALSIALIYYFRLPTAEDNKKRKDKETPSREDFNRTLSVCIPEFADTVQDELKKFVNDKNFAIPKGVAINQAIREHIFSIVVSVATRTPLCIIGAPGQSKTLSFQIVLQNLRGPHLSEKEFCKTLPEVDPFFCLGSKYTSSKDISYVFDRAIKREQQYQENRMATRCVVFLDEASLPSEKQMVLKVLHQYLDECKVAFVAISNNAFDAANANRMICIYRSLPSEDDQKILAYGCLGLPNESKIPENLKNMVAGLCQGYRNLLHCQDIPKIFHDRDFIYMLRELRFGSPTSSIDLETTINEITPTSLLYALENNFNGIAFDQFKKLVVLFFQEIAAKCPTFELPTDNPKQNVYRDVTTILSESMQLTSTRRRLYGRYKLVIDESEDESAVRLMFQTKILDPNKTTVFRLSDFSRDVDNELRNVEILSTIKLCMETGKTILMVNTGRIHGSLYDVFNQNFSIMATGDTRKIFSKVAIGPKTLDVVVHEDFQCIVHINRRDMKNVPAPFLSRFQKYSLSIEDFYRIQLKNLSTHEQNGLVEVEGKVKSFIEHFSPNNFWGLNSNTFYSLLLSLIEHDESGKCKIVNIHTQYTQLAIKTKSFVEKDVSNTHQYLLRFVLSKLIQLVSPESMIFKLPTFEDKIAQLLCTNYFHQQEHFSLENFIRQLISRPLTEAENGDGLRMTTTTDEIQENVNVLITTKVMIYTRTSSYVLTLNKLSKYRLLGNSKSADYETMSGMTDILNLGVFENAAELEEKLTAYKQDQSKFVLIIVINARLKQQCQNIPFVRQLVDRIENECNRNSNTARRKHFIILIHAPINSTTSKSYFSSIFLHEWDFYFFDTCAPGNAFHLQKMFQIICSSDNSQEEQTNDILCDLDVLFGDALWDFCSRIQILLHELPQEAFTDKNVYEFYRRNTPLPRRVQCLKKILQKSNQIQEQIINMYQEHISKRKKSFTKIYKEIYDVSKSILSGKYSSGLVDSIQFQTRISFTKFISHILKFIVNDYGLEALSKSSTVENRFLPMLSLIDLPPLTLDEDSQNLPSPNQGIFRLATQYSYIPQTPLYQLLHQRIKSLVDQVKQTFVELKMENPGTTGNSLRNDDRDQLSEPTQKQFYHTELTNLIMKDNVLTLILHEQSNVNNSDGDCGEKEQSLNESTKRFVDRYVNDFVQLFCVVVENTFGENSIGPTKAIDFISTWLMRMDEEDLDLFETQTYKGAWLLSYAYSSFEFERDTLLSLYSACRIIDRMNPNQSIYSDLLKNDEITRCEISQELMKLLFEQVWENLQQLCSGNDVVALKQWTYVYTFVSKYHSSNKLLSAAKFAEIRNRIIFMDLAYVVFLKEGMPEPLTLVNGLLQLLYFDSNGVENRIETSNLLKKLPSMVDTINGHISSKSAHDCTIMIDIHLWLVSILRKLKKPCHNEIDDMLKYINQAKCRMSFSVKQLLFDELLELSLENMKVEKRSLANRLKNLFPIVSKCIPEQSFQTYELPYQSHAIDSHLEPEHPILLDLFFFYLRRMANAEVVKWEILNDFMLLSVPQSESFIITQSIESVFVKFKVFFLLNFTGLFLCESWNDNDLESLPTLMKDLITNYLCFDKNSTVFSCHLQHFLSTIISKKSWNYLINELESNRLQQIDKNWAAILSETLRLKRSSNENKYLESCHQLQFTLSSESNDLSVFPKLHKLYYELSQKIYFCAEQNTDEQWNTLSMWIRENLNSNPKPFELNEIKAMLILNIYYDFYCNNRLESISTLLKIIERDLQPLPEELIVFHALLQPEKHIIGYQKEDEDENYLIDMFRLTNTDADVLAIRHLLVNLMTMIIFGGNQSFLWTFAFEPSKLSGTFGFGSTYQSTISSGVHYDCGCVLSCTGELEIRGCENTPLEIPAVYLIYFSTFGAIAWHLLLYNSSVDSLYGPILTPSKIEETAYEGYAMNNESVRTKTCHFVRARLAATFQFLSSRLTHNQNDSCILLNYSFERMGYEALNAQDPWIKPIYETFEEKSSAEQKYLSQIFSVANDKFPRCKAYIDTLHLQSQIQLELQKFISGIPIVIQMSHFTAEWCNPKYFTLPLTTVKRLANSMDFLKMTAHTYDLCRFYLLLHQTYSQMVGEKEFEQITLKELYERAKVLLKTSNRRQYQSEMETQWQIIQKGITAVKAYHEFTNGDIQPGACHQTQKFNLISEDSPVCYLVTTKEHDEGDIIMRILSILIDYHNNFLDIMEHELDSYEHQGIDILKYLINQIVPKEVSIIQVVSGNAGVITLNEDDHSCIENYALANLMIENENFPKRDTKLNFDYMNVQSFIIRTYLLLCHIKYKDISQKYMCFVPRNITNAISINDDDMFKLDENYSVPLDHDWNNLDKMPIDQLYHAYNILRQIASTLKDESDDRSMMELYAYANTMNDSDLIISKLSECKVQDFRLRHMNHVGKLYRDLVGRFLYLFTDTSPLLQRPLSNELSEQLNDNFQSTLNNTDDNIKLQCDIKHIDELLDALKDIEETLIQQGSESLVTICGYIGIENPLLQRVSEEIKCENYVSFSIQLIQARSELQEKAVNNEEKSTQQWNENFNDKSNQEGEQNGRNRFCPCQRDEMIKDDSNDSLYTERRSRNDDGIASIKIYEESSSNKNDEGMASNKSDEEILPNTNDEKSSSNKNDTNEFEVNSSSPIVDDIQVSPLFELNIEPIPLTALTSILENCNESNCTGTQKKLLTVVITAQPDGKVDRFMCRIEDIYNKLKDHMTKKKYDMNTYVIVDYHKIHCGIAQTNAPPNPLCLEYQIVESTLLVPIRFSKGEEQFEYKVMSDCSLINLIRRYIDEHGQRQSMPDFRHCFSDQFGRYIENGTIAELPRMDPEMPIIIVVTEENVNDSTFYAVTLKIKEGVEQKAVFHPQSTWKQIDIWRKTQLQQIDSPCVYMHKQSKGIFDENQFISMLEKSQSTLFGISQNEIRDVALSFGSNTHTIRALKSIRMKDLLNSDTLQQFNLTVPPNECIFTLDDVGNQHMSEDDMKKLVQEFDEPLRCRIWLKIYVHLHDIQKDIEVKVRDSVMTVNQILHSEEIPNNNYIYLASAETNVVIENDKKIVDLNQTRFLLLKEHETCLVLIEISPDKQVIGSDQRYATFGTIADILKNTNINDEYLLYSDTFVPGNQTKLKSFSAPIQFKVVKENLPAVVTITNTEQNDCRISLNCSQPTTLQCIHKISCQLLNEDERYCTLRYNDCEIPIDETTTLDDLESPSNNFDFQLVFTVDRKCSILFDNQTVVLPCLNETTVMELVKKVFQRFHIPEDEIDRFKVQLMSENDGKLDMEMDFTFDEVLSSLPDNTGKTSLTFELIIKDE